MQWTPELAAACKRKKTTISRHEPAFCAGNETSLMRDLVSSKLRLECSISIDRNARASSAKALSHIAMISLETCKAVCEEQTECAWIMWKNTHDSKQIWTHLSIFLCRLFTMTSSFCPAFLSCREIALNFRTERRKAQERKNMSAWLIWTRCARFATASDPQPIHDLINFL